MSNCAAGVSGILSHTLSSFTFKRYIVHPTAKLSVFTLCGLGYAYFLYSFASHNTFWGLVMGISAMNAFSGYGGAGVGGMMLYTMGPVC